jgi:hypothetical protein
LFCFARRNSAGGNAGAGLKVKIRIFVKKSSDFVQKVPMKLKKLTMLKIVSFCDI